MTQIEYAKQGIITKQIEEVAFKEKRSPEFIMEGLIKGTIVIPKNINHQIEAMGVGKGLRTKVNANIGTSSDIVDINAELLKVKAAIEAKADSLMDLSTGGDLDFFRRKILHES
ncbi:MAG: phosphomethylpyrimidine synthase ThiC, partial [Athalassotoga sp.]|uniref:phosphomethylpyrimidine synthase ThiC n=1 Tax=Athalassotoga sp. TaxID=2022597 RepID=UPI003D04641C